MTANVGPVLALPEWVPAAVRAYLEHTAAGVSLRAIARREGVHASTVLRQVRRFENRRDDPLIDQALGRLSASQPLESSPEPAKGEPQGGKPRATKGPSRKERAAHERIEGKPKLPVSPAEEAAVEKSLPGHEASSAQAPAVRPYPAEPKLLSEARRLLPLLVGPDRMLVAAADMDRAVIVRDSGQGSERLAILDRTIAEAMAIREWIVCSKPGRVARYVLAPAGRALMRKLGIDPGKALSQSADDEEGRFRPPPESPIALLARRRDAEGRPFLSHEQIRAALRLREDFEVARARFGSDPESAANFNATLASAIEGKRAFALTSSAHAREDTALQARERLEAALACLGPGLGEIALRCCCYQQGIETAEQDLGWSARSGKIVLRIALERLTRFYALLGDTGARVG